MSRLARILAVPPGFEPSIAGVRSRFKRTVTRAYIVAATWQKTYADRHLDQWEPPKPGPRLEIDVVTLASERARAELMRMVHSFLTHVGLPVSIRVVSDGSLSEETVRHVRRLSEGVEVVGIDHYAKQRAAHPVLPRLLAGDYPLGRKIPLLVEPVIMRPRLYVDTDIEFFRGGHRLRSLIEGRERRPHYTFHRDGRLDSYDARMIEGLSMPLGVNSGFCLAKETIDWSLALDRIAQVIDDPHLLSEQTAFAIAMAVADGVRLSPDDYVLDWDDLGVPWDRYARTDIVLRHYFSTALRWKLWMRVGLHGGWTLPLAAFEYAFQPPRW